MTPEQPVTLVAAPFDDDQPEVGMGTGPLALVQAPAVLGAAGGPAGNALPVRIIDRDGLGQYQLGRLMEIDARVAAEVAAALDAGGRAMVFAGNCHHAHLGSVAALRSRDPARRVGVVWFDAHADFDTPENVASGLFDSMGMTVLTGGTFNTLASRVPHFAPVVEQDILLVGVRDLRDDQWARLRASAVRYLRPQDVVTGFEAALAALSKRMDRLYLHVDLDCLDPAHGQANSFAAPGGLSVDRLTSCVDLVCQSGKVDVAALTAYDATLDPAMAPIAIQVACNVVRCLSR